MLKSFPRLALYIPAALLSVAYPVYDLTQMQLPVVCEPIDSVRWWGLVPLIVAVVLIPFSIIVEKSHDHQSGLALSLVSLLTVILGFANVYAGSGIVQAAVGDGENLATIWTDYIYFSATTFTTLGYGDFVPCPGVRLLTSLEAMLGLLYGPLLVGLSVNKFINLRAHAAAQDGPRTHHRHRDETP